MKKHHLILGSSAASMGVLSKLRTLCPKDTITCLTAQSEMPYNTCLLADFVSTGEPPRGLYTKTDTFFQSNDITLHRDHRVVSIDATAQSVTCSNGSRFSFDTLFIGTGTTPRTLQAEHPCHNNLFNFATLSDALALDVHIRTEHPRTALVIGAGLSGVECADALNERGIAVTILEYHANLLPSLINTAGAKVLMHHMTAAGVSFQPHCTIAHLLVNADKAACGVALHDGTKLYADMIVVAIGATPCTSFIPKEMALHQQSIAVNRSFQTSIPHIYAGGDVSAVPQAHSENLLRSGTWPDAMQHGMLAARAMAGNIVEYPGLTMVLSSKFFGTQFVSCGPVTHPPTDITITEKKDTESYQLFLTKEGTLQGFLLIHHLAQVGALRQLVSTQKSIPADFFKAITVQR